MSTQHATTQVPAADVGMHMQPVLVDLIALSLNAKQAHWHVRGQTFTQVHEQLDSLIADARDYADNVAERLVALGVTVDGRPDTVAQTTAVGSFVDGWIDTNRAVSLITEQIDAVIARAREGLAPLGDLDPPSQDVVIEVLRGLEKHRWMFAAQTSG